MPTKISPQQQRALVVARKRDEAGNKVIAESLKTAPLVEGTTAKSVRWVERMLEQAGFKAGVRDDKFTPETTKALKAFQESVGLPVTGEFDAATFGKLKNVQTRARETDTFGVGENRAAIKDAEVRLQRMGYDVGKADGIFSLDTSKAMQAFKKDERMKSKSGLAGAPTLNEIKKEAGALAHDPTRIRRTPSRQRTRLNGGTAKAAARKSAEGQVGFGEGSKGPSVKNVQGHLRAAGYDPKRADGVFDERTAGALKAFQRRSGLPETGRVTPRVWAKLQQAVVISTKDGSPAMRLGEKSGAVHRAESLLKKLGYNPGKVDGTFSAATEKAMKRYENKRARVGTDGKIDSRDLRIMKADLKRKLNPPGKKVTAYVRGSPRSIRVNPIPNGEFLRSDAAKSYNKMYAAARKQGITLAVNDGFRSMSEQQYLYNLYKSGRGNVAAPPGYSNHQNGIATDIQVGGWGTSTFNWLARNAGRYGFSNAEGRSVNEPWHWVYVR